MSVRTSEIARIGIFAALAVTGGYLFAFVPNVEIYTAVLFLAGVLLGKRNGVLVALVAQLIYGLFNPFGASPLPLLLAQMFSYAVVGFAGGFFSAGQSGQIWLDALKYGVTGFLLTLQYDVMTFLSYGLMSGFSVTQMQTSFWAGLPFYMVHWIGNTLIFALVLPLVLRGLRRTQVTKVFQTN